MIHKGDLILRASQTYENITKICGDLIINKISSKNFIKFKLNNLKEIDGTVSIYESSIENFLGLDALVEIGNYFSIEKCSKLKNFQGLGSLKRINSSIYVETCKNLQSFEGLGQIESLIDNAQFNITDCPNITLDGLPDDFDFNILCIHGENKKIDFTGKNLHVKIKLDADLPYRIIVAPFHVAEKAEEGIPILIQGTDIVYCKNSPGNISSPYKQTKEYSLYKMPPRIMVRRSTVIAYSDTDSSTSVKEKEQNAIYTLENMLINKAIKGEL